MLQTNLKHILSEAEFHKALREHDHVMICCGRMGPMCIPVYAIMKAVEAEYPHVWFFDLEFDAAHAHVIRELPACKEFRGLPFTVYFKNGLAAKATAGIQTMDQVRYLLDHVFGAND